MWDLDCEENWVLKNWCFWTLALEKTLKSPLDCKEIQPSILKEISSWCSLEGLMLKLKLQFFGHLMWRVNSLEKLWCWGLGAGGEGDDRGWDGWMGSPTWWTWVWVNSGSWWWTGRPGMLWLMESQKVGHDWVNELDWTESKNIFTFIPLLKNKTKPFSLILSFTIYYYGIHVGIFLYAKV